jgi:hypothetical protein
MYKELKGARFARIDALKGDKVNKGQVLHNLQILIEELLLL